MARINLGRIRTVFKGEWVAAAYVIDDVVLYAGSSYTCIAVAASANAPTDTTHWTKSAGGLEFMGAWDTSTTYKVNQIATFNGSTFIAVSSHTGTQPIIGGNASWAVIAGGFKFEGAWDTSVAYHVNDVVTLNGSSFIAITAHTGTQPEAAGNAAWVLFASGGDIADQTGNIGKVLSTDGTSTSWVSGNPDQSGNSGKVLSTDGSSTAWSNVGVTELGITDGSSGDYLSTDGSGTLSFVTPSSGGDQDFELLGSCFTNSQWNGHVCIPPEKRGMFTRYKVMGVTCCHQYYCSQLAMAFAGASTSGAIKATNDCQCNNQASYCCAHDSCGSVNQWKCFGSSEVWACAGSIPWINGCSSGCATACANQGYAWEFNLYPFNPCWYDNDARRGRFFNRRDGGVGSDNNDCCGFFHNVGRITPCCGGHVGCLQSMCWGSPGGSASAYGKGSIQIFGMGRITKSQTNGDGTSWVKPSVPGDRNF